MGGDLGLEHRRVGDGVGYDSLIGEFALATTSFHAVTALNDLFGLIWLSGSMALASAMMREAQPSIFSRLRSRAGLRNPVPFCVFQRRLLICHRITGLLAWENSLRSPLRINSWQGAFSLTWLCG